MAKTSCSQFGGPRFNPWSENASCLTTKSSDVITEDHIYHNYWTQCSQIKKKKNYKIHCDGWDICERGVKIPVGRE